MTAAITDFSQYAELRRGADGGDPAVLREVAGQFEALFLQSMLKSMRDASLGDPLFGDNDGHEMYQEMFDQQLAVEMSSGKGIGLADMLVQQLGGKQAIPAPPTFSAGLPKIPTRAAAVAAKSGGLEATMAAPDAPGAALSTKPNWDNAEDFARDIWPHAQRVAKRLDVAPEAVMAQAALETGWGKHVMSSRDGTFSHNLFGIKASDDWQGDSVARRTVEFAGGIARHEVAKFRSYDDVAASFDDYAEFLSTRPRYAAVIGSGADIDGFANAIADSGYATDPAYAQKISRVANSETMNRVLEPLKNAAAVSINE